MMAPNHERDSKPGKTSSRKRRAPVVGEGPAEFRHRLEESEPSRQYLLRLYVTGVTPRSAAAIKRVREVCEEHLKGRYELEVIDIYQLPSLAKDQQIVATPTLIKVLPQPLRRFIGDLSAVEKVLFGLDLREKKP